MIGAIPNPTRTITVPATYDNVQGIMDNLGSVMSQMRIEGYNLKEKNTILGQYRYTKTEFLSLGVEILVTIEENNEKTKITVEIQRVLGAFDSWVEVHNANKHLEVMFKAIAFGINPPSQEQIVSIQQKQESENDTNQVISVVFGVIFFFIVLGVAL